MGENLHGQDMSETELEVLAEALRQDHPDIVQYDESEGPLSAWRMCIASVTMVLAKLDADFDREAFIKACMP